MAKVTLDTFLISLFCKQICESIWGLNKAAYDENQTKEARCPSIIKQYDKFSFLLALLNNSIDYIHK